MIYRTEMLPIVAAARVKAGFNTSSNELSTKIGKIWYAEAEELRRQCFVKSRELQRQIDDSRIAASLAEASTLSSTPGDFVDATGNRKRNNLNRHRAKRNSPLLLIKAKLPDSAAYSVVVSRVSVDPYHLGVQEPPIQTETPPPVAPACSFTIESDSAVGQSEVYRTNDGFVRSDVMN
ncbi:hypothetical protein BDR26DRAFT_653172 [Obelidium mucronatum]|nr:hypothetical protein BDR26DRAFT_653172 [Obelidium mucronatum]